VQSVYLFEAFVCNSNVVKLLYVYLCVLCKFAKLMGIMCIIILQFAANIVLIV